MKSKAKTTIFIMFEVLLRIPRKSMAINKNTTVNIIIDNINRAPVATNSVPQLNIPFEQDQPGVATEIIEKSAARAAKLPDPNNITTF